MVEVIEGILDLTAQFINGIFMFQIELDTGQYFPIGKIVVAVVYFTTSAYLFLDALGILDEGE